jgi:hypothetical protein
MKRRCVGKAAIALMISGLLPLCHAQSLAGGGPVVGGANGLQIYGATASTGYSSLNLHTLSLRDSAGIGGEAYTWASVSLGFSHQNVNHTLRIHYTPSYSGSFQTANLHSFNHNLKFDLTERLKPQWTFYLRGSGDESTLQQFLFKPGSSLQLLTDGNPDQLADTIIGAPAGAPGIKSQLQNTFYGIRVLSFGSEAGITYRSSPRLSISAGGGLSQSQSKQDDQSASVPVLIPRTRLEQGSVTVSYSLSPRTAIGAGASTITTQSGFGNYQSSTFTGNYGRKLGMHWFGSMAGGIGTFHSSKTTGSTPGRSSYVASATLGYQTQSQAWIASYGRTVGDTYGLVSGSTTNFLVTWTWKRPGAAWGVVASGGQQELKGGPVGAFTTWQATAGVTRSVTRQLNLSMEYAYLKDTTTPKGVFDDIHAHMIRLTFFWIPQLRQGMGRGKG